MARDRAAVAMRAAKHGQALGYWHLASLGQPASRPHTKPEFTTDGPSRHPALKPVASVHPLFIFAGPSGNVTRVLSPHRREVARRRSFRAKPGVHRALRVHPGEYDPPFVKDSHDHEPPREH